MIDDVPCKVLSISLSKPGKHGSTKARLDAVGIFDDKKRNLLKPADAAVQVPIIEKKKAQVISVSGGFVQLMDMEEYNTFDAEIPDDMKGKLESATEATIQPFEQVRDLLADKVQEEKTRAEMGRYLERLRAQAIIEWKNPELEKLYREGLAAQAKGAPTS